MLAVMSNLSIFILIAVLFVALVTDILHYKIYNWLIIMGLLAGLLLNLETSGLVGLWLWFKGVGVAYLAFIPIYLVRGMAAGDVKLMMAVGGLLSFPVLIDALMSTYIAGGVVALAYVVYRKQGAKLLQNIKQLMFGQFVKMSSGVVLNDEINANNSVGKMPYAVAICIGTVYALQKNGFVV